MKKKIFRLMLILGLAAAGILAGFYLAGGKSSGREPAAAGSLTVSEESGGFFDFGEVKMSQGLVRHEFILKNEGEGSLSIKKVYTSCMCTVANLKSGEKQLGPFGMPGHTSPRTNMEIGPGGEVTLEAVFDPNAHGPSGVGLAERQIYIETDSADSPKLELSFRANVVP